jgi:hypothetical protein
MTDNDRILAQRVLEKKRLSVEQVQQLLAECDRSGHSFRDIALGRGLLSAQDFQVVPPKQIPLPVMLILGVGLSILAIVVVNTTLNRQEETKTTAVQAADPLAIRAKQSLAKAREAMARADSQTKDAGASPDHQSLLDEAIAGYGAYLQRMADDADVRIERARAYELRGLYDQAIADLEIAARAKPDRAPALQDKIARLRPLQTGSPK